MSFVELLPPAEATPDNPRWHELRRGGVTASEIATILGWSRFDSAWALWHRKRQLIPDVDTTDDMRWGQRIEPVVADAFAEQHPELMLYPAGLYAHSERPWQMATPDRLCTDGPGDDIRSRLVALLEAKHPYSWDGWGDDGSDDAPVGYVAQALWQLDVLDLDLCYLAAYSRHQMRVYEIRRSVEGAEHDLEQMRKAAQEFLASDWPPPLDSHPATLHAAKQLHPDVHDIDVTIPDPVADRYLTARAALHDAEAEQRQAETALRLAMAAGRRAVTTTGHRLATRVIYDRRSLDSAALRRDHPHLADQYTTVTTVDSIRTSTRKDTPS